jgi:hypothetical protein
MAGERLPARFSLRSQFWFRGTGKCFETATSHMQTVIGHFKTQKFQNGLTMTRIFIILFSLIGFESIYCQSDKLSKDCSEKKYSYEIIIDMNHLQRSDSYNYKYLLNKSWEFIGENEVISYDDNTLYYIQYNYVPAPQKGFDIYDRIPLDTLKICLTDHQLDSIYYLASRLFQIDKTLSIDYKENFAIYDGHYSKVTLRLDNYSVMYEIVISFDTEQLFQKRYYDLETYLEKIKNGL